MTDARGNKPLSGIVALLAAVVVIIGVLYMWGSSKNNDTPDGDAVPDNGVSQIVGLIEGTNLSQSAAEAACQDAKYGVTNGYDLVYVWNYNFQIMDAAEYDKSGNRIKIATWNGKDSSTDEIVTFQCYFSGSSDELIDVYYISAGGVDVWKTLTDLNYNSYNSLGEPDYPELH